MNQQQETLDIPERSDEQSKELRRATERAELAEAELANLKATASSQSHSALESIEQSPTASIEIDVTSHKGERSKTEDMEAADTGGLQELRKDSMMTHLLDSLDAGKDIGHYGRLVFAMVARHFLPPDEVIRYLTEDNDFSEEQALVMLRQVEGRDYNPPKRERILEWQNQQNFPILPNPEDPDCGNLYRNLKFPAGVYDHIGHYQEEKLHADE